MKLKILSAAALVMLAGCAYHIGSVKPLALEGINSIGIPTFVNKTFEPRTEVLVTNSVIKQFQQDGTFEIKSYKRADAILEGEIIEFERRRARSVRGNVAASREFTLTLLISYTLTERETGRVLLTRDVEGETSFFVGEDVQQDERQAIPLAAEQAAIRLVSQVSEGGH